MRRQHAGAARCLARPTTVHMPVVRLSETRAQAKDEEEAGTMTVIPFGKYAGTPIEELPLDYIAWCSGELDLDAARTEARNAAGARPGPNL